MGHISGGHFNPAVTIGLWAGGRFSAADIIPYIVAQVVGAIAAAGVLYLIASGKAGFTVGGFASNGYDALSPGKYSMISCLLMEVVATFFFLIIILSATHCRAAADFALRGKTEGALPAPDAAITRRAFNHPHQH